MTCRPFRFYNVASLPYSYYGSKKDLHLWDTWENLTIVNITAPNFGLF